LDLVGPLMAARRPPCTRTVIDAALILDVQEQILTGAWPREIPPLVGVSEKRWIHWLRQGAEDVEEGADTPEAELYGLMTRSRIKLEQIYRQGMLHCTLDSKNWQCFAWLLVRVNPKIYSEKVLESVEAEVLRLLKVVQGAVDPEMYGTIVAALEQAREAGGGTPLSFTEPPLAWAAIAIRGPIGYPTYRALLSTPRASFTARRARPSTARARPAATGRSRSGPVITRSR
jgi:hypothetical protein